MTKRLSTKLHAANAAQALQSNSSSDHNDSEMAGPERNVLKEATASLGTATDELSSSLKTLTAARHTLEVAEINLREKQTAISERSAKLATLALEVEFMQTEQAEVEQAKKAAQAQLAAKEDELASVHAKLAEAQASLIELQSRIAEEEAKFAALAGELETVWNAKKAQADIISDHEPLWQRPLLKLFDQLQLPAGKMASACRDVAKSHFSHDNVSTLVLASLAQALTPRDFLRKWYGFSLFKNGLNREAAYILNQLDGKVSFSLSEQRAFEQIKALVANESRTNECEFSSEVQEDELARTDVVELTAPRDKTEDSLRVGPRSDLAHLRVACIMDEFTFSSYAPEATFQALTPENWEEELTEFGPELLFIESAWRGKDEKWGSKVGHLSQELQGILKWCRAHHVPTVFWNKEDPVHFETFLNTAAQFDHVFTTDIDCIGRYKAALGHDRVYLLPFACQPALHNPIETYDRKDAFCFAGAYYVKYPDRTRDLESFVEELPKFRPLEIYDRNYGKNHPDYQFPESYHPFIVGTLPFDQIDRAYKGYNYAINLNSIKQSQSMFARRVFDLLASNTITVSNFSRGLRLLFGDLVITSDSGREIVRRMKDVISDESHSRRLRLAGLRKVMREHTYGDRLAYIASKALGRSAATHSTSIAVVALAQSLAELESLVSHYQRQVYTNTTLQIILSGEWSQGITDPEPRIRLLNEAAASNLTMADIGSEADFVAFMVPEDYYGPYYLLDIALATRYSSANVIGKGAQHLYVQGRVELLCAEQVYRPVRRLALRSAAIRSSYLLNDTLMDWVTHTRERFVDDNSALSIDEFNYCRNGAQTSEIPPVVVESVNDLPSINLGTRLEELLERAEKLEAASDQVDEAPTIIGRDLSLQFPASKNACISLSVDGDFWSINSSLPDGKHDYIYSIKDYRPSELGYTGKIRLFFDTTPGLNLSWVVLFLDEKKQRLGHTIIPANRNRDMDLPEGTVWLRFGLRVYSGGASFIRCLVLGSRRPTVHDLADHAQQLLITNNYPSYEDLYRNGFVHRRVLSYRENGTSLDVFRLREHEGSSYHEFENVDCITGPQQMLRKMLDSGRYRSVLVHFLSETMWDVLKDYIDKVKVVVWVHGAEIQPFHRREHAYSALTPERRADAIASSDKRLVFWRDLLQQMPENLKLIFVSQHFAETVMEDLGFRLPPAQWAVIHNPIDTNLFGYHTKDASFRKKILSIRPFASKVYANDLSVKAILLLAQKPCFKDFEFRIVGDGPLFKDTVAPLLSFENVIVEQRFLTQTEIAGLHKEYGVFLCPSRMDTQGVSRDEAMASGLVPVTTRVAAIPEFVDDSCGMLAEPEDAHGLAECLVRLYDEPGIFVQMSAAASERVRRQSAADRIVTIEMAQFG